MKIRENQLLLVFALLRSPMRMAARFRIPVATLLDLVRVAYYETLRAQGLSQAEVGRRMGQTSRNMRLIASKRAELFKEAEGAGAVRDVEALVAERMMLPSEVPAQLRPSYTSVEVLGAIKALLAEKRIEYDEDGRLQGTARYVSLTNDHFSERLKALHEHLDGVHQAVLHRLVFNQHRSVVLMTLTFRAKSASLDALIKRAEAQVQEELVLLEEDAARVGSERSFTVTVALAPTSES